MIVVCKRGTKKLIKGHRYEVSRLWNSVTTSGRVGRVLIEGIGSFSTTTFTTTDGKELPKVNYTKPGGTQTFTRLKFENLSIGDVLVCKVDRYKSFVQNGMYKIEDLVINKLYKLSFKVNSNNVLAIHVPGVKSIVSKKLPTNISVTIEGSKLVFKGNPSSNYYNDFKVKLDGHDDIVGKITFMSWGSSSVSDISNRYVKFVGVPRKMKVNSWNFRKLNAEESREQALSHILDNEEVKVITSTDKRNIELVDDKDDVLLKTLAKSILDTNRHHLSIIEWASKKIGDKLQIENKDYDPYLNMTLAQILQKIK